MAPSLPPVYIAGVAETPLGEVPDHTELSMVALAAREALAEAGMTLADVDGIGTAFMGPQGSIAVAEYLGIREPRFSTSSDLGGSAFESLVHHAMLAIATGRCEVALIAYASRQRSKRSRTMHRPGDPEDITTQFEVPFGLPAPVGRYALAAARHMHEFGTTEAQLAEVAVTAREWANLNPKAWSHGKPLTVQDVLDSKPISTPLKRHDCCLVTDGGGVVVLTTEARARDAAKRPIRVLGAAESHTHVHVMSMPSLVRTAGAVSGREAFAMAGVGPADVDVLEPYDSFTITVLLALEDLGFCGPGESGAFVEEGNLRPGGSLPAMTQGGGLSYNHPGAFGLLLLIEAVRQLRGECGERQVPGDPEIAVAHGVGWYISSASTVVLARD
jgi:acetyl-CoA acetyltransferase